ncbi:PASTA domain-containing protein [Streptomyces sp. 549]|uniref:PASTA domain-containing protein n=1 Tax=Streptomyces sp. 549 TaxID=3049076 RepID=UPI0024C2FF4A|nr:PASTA domain-containing protein [Streptomyces sp. 549]MDK1475752.1 PASTA domain-containing protein [Streptomyces sp. 549]
MGIRRVCAVPMLVAALALSVAACEVSTDDPEGSPLPGSSSPAEPDGSSDGSPGDAKKSPAAEAELPDLVGMGLQSAQDTAQEAGFGRLTSHDALGRGRAQAFDRNWKVCFQDPAPGTHPTDGTVDMGTVKLDEQCPEEDRKPEQANGSMPEFKGKSVRAARQALDSSTSIEVQDATGEERITLIESNWRVCSQEPKAGTELTGQPVTLRAVKFEEKCP